MRAFQRVGSAYFSSFSGVSTFGFFWRLKVRLHLFCGGKQGYTRCRWKHELGETVDETAGAFAKTFGTKDPSTRASMR
jgi:hypothetical protein